MSGRVDYNTEMDYCNAHKENNTKGFAWLPLAFALFRLHPFPFNQILKLGYMHCDWILFLIFFSALLVFSFGAICYL